MTKRLNGGSSPTRERKYKAHPATTEKHKVRNIKHRLKRLQKANPKVGYEIQGRNVVRKGDK